MQLSSKPHVYAIGWRDIETENVTFSGKNRKSAANME
jgi:hypothetical protein